MSGNKKKAKESGSTKKRPFAKSDFEAVLQAATKPLKNEPAEKVSGKT